MESRQTLPAGSLKVRLFSKHRPFPAGFFLDFPKSGQFRAENDRIAAIRSQTLLEATGLRQSGAKRFGKRQDCGNPEPNASGNDRIAAIRSQTLRETTRLQQSGAIHFGKRQDCGNPEPNTFGNDRIAAIRHFPDRTNRDFLNPRIPQTRLAPLHPPMKPRAAPDCRNPEPHHAPCPHLSTAASMPAAEGRLCPSLRHCPPKEAGAPRRPSAGGGRTGCRAPPGEDSAGEG